jgi:RNA 3'-terminal phosphate cyclase (ATP)
VNDDLLLIIDGSEGEGGGQILRTSLSLSVITGRPFRIYNIRANRDKPGLRRQHLAAVRAAAEISGATLTGDAVDSRDLTFIPKSVRAGTYHFDVGSAGSTMLVLQTVLPPLMIADAPTTLTLAGGTHNFGAPPFTFLERTFLPLINRMGPSIDSRLHRHGFAPAGGGSATVHITPRPNLAPLHLNERRPITRMLAKATVAGLPTSIAERELDAIKKSLRAHPHHTKVEELPPDQGPGNIVTIEIESDELTEVVTAFGQRGVPAERVARAAADEAKRYVDANVPVGGHLADQLMLPLALARGGSFLTPPLSLHSHTNINTIRKFVDVKIDVRDAAGGNSVVTMSG